MKTVNDKTEHRIKRLKPQSLAKTLIPKSLRPQAHQFALSVADVLDSVGVKVVTYANVPPEVEKRISRADMPVLLRRRLLSMLANQDSPSNLVPCIVTNVLYLSGGLTPDAIKDVMTLQKRGGLKCVMLVPAGKDNGHSELARHQDVECVEYSNSLELVTLLREAKADVTIARRGNPLEAVLALLFGPGKTVYRPYDFVLRYPPEALKEMFWESAVHLAEAHLLKHADGVMHLHEDVALQFIRDNYGYEGPGLILRPGCMDEFCKTPRLPKLSEVDGGIHVVYAAGLARRNADQRMVGKSDNYDDFVKILEQGMHLHLYVPYLTQTDMEDGLLHYFELRERFPNFHMEKTLPYEELALDLTKYDYAYCYAPRRGTTRLREFEGNLSNNFYTYIDAGLPVICCPDSWAMAKLVKEDGIGIVVPDGGIDMLGEMLDGVDHDQLRKNVVAARPSLMYPADEFLAFLHSICETLGEEFYAEVESGNR